MVLWITQLPRAGQIRAQRAWRVRGLWSDALAWQVTLFMGLQSAFAYIVFGWLAPILRDRGLDPVQAGLVVSVSVLGQAAASLFRAVARVHHRARPAGSHRDLLPDMHRESFLACLIGPLSWIWFWSIVAGAERGGAVRDRPDVDSAARPGRACGGESVEHVTERRICPGIGRAAGGRPAARLERELERPRRFCAYARGGDARHSGVAASRARHVGAVSVQA